MWTSAWCRLLLKSLIAATEVQQAELFEPLMELYGQALLYTPQVLSTARCCVNKFAAKLPAAAFMTAAGKFNL